MMCRYSVRSTVSFVSTSVRLWDRPYPQPVWRARISLKSITKHFSYRLNNEGLKVTEHVTYRGGADQMANGVGKNSYNQCISYYFMNVRRRKPRLKCESRIKFRTKGNVIIVSSSRLSDKTLGRYSDRCQIHSAADRWSSTPRTLKITFYGI